MHKFCSWTFALPVKESYLIIFPIEGLNQSDSLAAARSLACKISRLKTVTNLYNPVCSCSINATRTSLREIVDRLNHSKPFAG